MFRALTAAVVLLCAAAAYAESITVSAAVSLKESLQAIAKDYQASTGDTVEFNFGASGQLLSQIQQGAPVDAFISAAQPQLTQLRKDGLATDAPARIIVRNQLVLIVPSDSPSSAITSFQSLSSPEVKRLAIGQPKAVPAGDYAMQVLDHLNLTASLKDRLIFGGNVRQVLEYVTRGEVDAGIVYATDAREAGSRVKVLATARGDWHKPIVYPALVLKSSTKQTTASRFLDYLLTDKAQAIFSEHGFSPDERLAAK